MPSVSAIVVTFRSHDVIAGLLSDLEPAVAEIVVVDNASDDGTLDVVANTAPDAVVMRHTANCGFAAGVNAGVAASTGDLLLVCNPDLRLDTGSVAALVTAAQRHPGDVVGPVLRLPDGRLQLSRSGPPTLWSLFGEQLVGAERVTPGTWPWRWWARWQPYDREVEGPLLSGACLLIPRATWDATGPLDESYFLYWEEMDWQLRARALGHRTWLVPQARATHVRAASTGTHSPDRARLLHASTRRFVARWLPGWRHVVALAILAAGQALRAAAWSLPPLRQRPGAAARAAFHRAGLTALLHTERAA